MLVSPHTHKVIHHGNCSYCEHKTEVGQRRKGRTYTLELCGISLSRLPENRYCENYIQAGCQCDACQSGRYIKQVVHTIDREINEW